MRKRVYKKLTRKGVLQKGGLPALKLVIKEELKKIMQREQRTNTHYRGNCCEWCNDLAAGRAIGNYPPEGCEDWNCNSCR